MTEFKIPFDTGDRNTPIVVTSREQGVDGSFYIAPFLPLVRATKAHQTYIVLNAGKVVSFLTSTEHPDMKVVVPAGLKKDLEEFITAVQGGATDEATASANCKNKYTVIDVQEGVHNYAGNLVIEGEAVVASMVDADYSAHTATAKVVISDPVGVLSYNALRSAYKTLYSLSEANMGNTVYMNFRPQDGIAFSKVARMELPIVKSDTKNSFKMRGLTCLAVEPTWTRVDTTKVMGAYLTYDADSDLVLADMSSVKWYEIVGRVYFVENVGTELPANLTDYVKTTPNPNSLPEQFRVTSNATGGLDESLYLTDALGKARVNVFVL